MKANACHILRVTGIIPLVSLIRRNPGKGKLFLEPLLGEAYEATLSPHR